MLEYCVASRHLAAHRAITNSRATFKFRPRLRLRLRLRLRFDRVRKGRECRVEGVHEGRDWT